MKFFFKFSIVILAFVISFSPYSWSKSPESIIDEVEKLYQGNSSRVKITMKIVTEDYERSLSLQGITVGDDLANFRILSPKKDRGVATLMRFKEMWNFLPKIDRVIKVPPSMMMSSWMGSDFTNDDLVKQTHLSEEYDLTLSEKEDSYIITLIPRVSTVTVWGKIQYHILKEHLIPTKQIFYESRHLSLDSSKAFKFLKWRTILNAKQALKLTFEWHKFYNNRSLRYQIVNFTTN